MPLGDNKIVVLGNANILSNIDQIATPLTPGVTRYDDILFSQTAQYYYGKTEIDLQIAQNQTYNIDITNLCSKIRASFLNQTANMYDSVILYIDNISNTTLFNGSITASKIERSAKFTKDGSGLLAKDSLLVFPDIATTPAVAHTIRAKFYKSGVESQYTENIEHNFKSNKVLNILFDIKNTIADIDLTITESDWECQTQDTKSGIITFNLNSTPTVSYSSKVDIKIEREVSPTEKYPIEYHNIPISIVDGVLQTTTPIATIETGDYTIKSIVLHDSEGSFQALIDEQPFTVGIVNSIAPINILTRAQYEHNILKEWFLILDGVGGNSYPGATIYNKISTQPSYNLFTDAAALNITTQSIDGEERISNLDISSKSLNSLNTIEKVKELKRLTQLSCTDNQIANIDLRDLPNLQSIKIGGNEASIINLNGCSNLESFDLSFTAQDYAALQVLDCGDSKIKILSPSFVNLENLTWHSCNLTETDIAILSNYLKLLKLDISNNNLQQYPNVEFLTDLLLVDYNVSNNSIITCAFPYMKIYGVNNILKQRLRINSWCQ